MNNVKEIRGLIKFYLLGFWQRRWIVAGVAWVIVLFGWFSISTMPNKYSSSARIYVDTETLLRPLMSGLAIQPNMSQQVEIMRRSLMSRPNVAEIIRKTDRDHFIQNENQRQGMVKGLTNSIQIRSQHRNQLFEVSYSNKDPVMAQKTVKAVLDLFVELNLGSTQQDMEQARTFIDKQIEDYEEKLRLAELKVAKFKQQYALELAGGASAGAVAGQEEQIKVLEREKQSLEWRRDQLTLELEKTPEFMFGGGGGGGAGGPLVALQEELDTLLIKYTRRHPDVQSVLARIESMKARMAKGEPVSEISQLPNAQRKNLQASVDSVNLEINSLDFRLELAKQRLEEMKSQVNTKPEIEAELTRHTRDYGVLKKNYNALISRREAAALGRRLDEDTQNVEFRVIDPPLLPIKPSGPPRTLYATAVLLVGLGAGFGLAFVLMLVQETFFSERQLAERLELPVLGSIGVIKSAVERRASFMEVSLAVTTGAMLLVAYITVSTLFSMGWNMDLIMEKVQSLV